MLKDVLFRRSIMYGFAVFVIGFSMMPSVVTIPVEDYFLSACHGNILYVGGNEQGNYTKIQDAVDNASDGDTIYVYDDSSPYLENVEVDKTLTLIGKNRDTTVIDGSRAKYTITISADNVIINGFTIQNSGGSSGSAGVCILCDHNTISGNIIKKTSTGIITYYENWALSDGYNVISENIITDNQIGMDIQGYNNIVSRNNISHNEAEGIVLEEAYNNNVFENIITDVDYVGILLTYSSNNIISQNIISNNNIGIMLLTSSNDKIIQNNFMGNIKSAYFKQSLLERIEFCKILGEPLGWITWDENYWNGPRLLPKPIFGLLQLGYYAFDIPNFVNFDWHPAQKLYEIIEGG